VLASAPRRLPGIRFEPEPPPPTPLLPRMDIAVFVGFAERGPLDTPVAVEDMARFTEVFGVDLPLAWDAERGEAVTAQLRPAVHAFFRNGGRRCWIVRVAGSGAAAAEFPVPGLLRCRSGRSPKRSWDGEVAPARLQASSKGPWAQRDTVAASVAVMPLRIEGQAGIETIGDASDGHARIVLPLRASVEEVLVGDVLRLRLVQDRVVFVAVDGIEQVDHDHLVAHAERSAWFREVRPADPGVAVVGYVDARGRPRAAHGTVVEQAGASDQAVPTSGGSSAMQLAIDIDADGGEWPAPGSWVRLSFGRRRWWLVVETTSTLLDDVAGTERVRVTGPAFLRTWPSPRSFQRTFAGASGTPVRADGDVPGNLDRLRLTLWGGVDGRLDERREDLGLASGHPRFLGDLPSDERVFGHEPWRPWESAADRAALAARRFRVAGDPSAAFYIPFALGPVPTWSAGPVDRGRPAIELSDLAEVGSDVFLDAGLAGCGAARLAAEADFIRYESPRPRPLRGIHAALDVEEASLIAVPDAGQPHWRREHVTAPSAPVLPESTPPEPATFDDCELGPLDPPSIAALREPGAIRSYTLVWSAVEHATAYVVEETREPESWRPPVLRQVEATRQHVGRSVPGTYRYRVRAVAPGIQGPWSEAVSVVVEGQPLYRVDDRTDRSVALQVHTALLRMCAARGDMFALLSVPEGLDRAGVTDHIADLRGRITDLPPDRLRGRLSGDIDPLAVLSYGALYHPWVLEADDAATSRRAPGTAGRSTTIVASPARPRPPDGAIMGVFAQRAATRGPWVAPANVPLRDVVGLVRPFADDEQGRLFEAQIDVLRDTPAGFMALAADTLSLDPTFRPLNVRRLLALLRRLAALHGTDYVFEPNSDAFRRRIQRGFEALLALLFERGAFAGARADDAFRVAVDDPPNSSRSLDAGRLIVDLKVAPSVPLEFLTVRLVRSGDRFAVELP